MIFKCKNCGGNSIYNPATGSMHCPHCESEESQEKIQGVGLQQCGNCGAPLEPGDHTSAMKCPNCGSYHIFEERISGEYTPHLVLPFKITKEQAVAAIKAEFKKRFFTPKEYLSYASISKMEGVYVPFFMYDFHSDITYRAVGTKVRTWTSGDYKYTETSYYQVERDMDAEFRKIPVDGSLTMDNSVMDLMEPYEYKALVDFEDKYMSGFLAEKYSDDKEILSNRARQKARDDSKALLRETLNGYATLSQINENIDLQQRAEQYVLLPVWVYEFEYRGKKYTYHVNGQTGKVIGHTPVAYPKLFAYTAAVFAACLAVSAGAFFASTRSAVEALSSTRANSECATTERVFDYADVLTDAEEDSLRELIAEKEVETCSDIVIVTLNETLEEYVKPYEETLGDVPTDRWVMVYADNFYEEHKFGFNAPIGDGTLLLDNWYREADGGVYSWMLTSGNVMNTFSSGMIDSVLDYSLAVVEESPYEAYYRFVCEYENMYIHDDGEELNPLVLVLGSFVIALIFLVINCIGRKGKKTTTSSTYVAGGRPVMRLREDRFLRKSVSKVRMQSSSSSGGGGGHRSAGGSSFGGGGHRR